MGYVVFVNIWESIYCPWCGQSYGKKIVGKKQKLTRHDTDEFKSSIIDYHDICWAEAIEVEI